MSRPGIDLVNKPLAHGEARQTAVVDNTIHLVEDVTVRLEFVSGAAGVKPDGVVNVFVIAIADDEGRYGQRGFDPHIDFVPPRPINALLAAQMTVIKNDDFRMSSRIGVAQCFRGFLPPRWALVIQNLTGAEIREPKISVVK